MDTCEHFGDVFEPFTLLLRSLLQDFYHDPSILDVDGRTLCLACIQIALQTYGVSVPFMDESSEKPWHTVTLFVSSQNRNSRVTISIAA